MRLATLLLAALTLPGLAYSAGDQQPTLSTRDPRDPNGGLEPAPDSTLGGELNRGLPAWLKLSFALRERVEGYQGGAYQPASTDLYDLSRIRLGVWLKPVSWFRIYGEAQDARTWAKHPSLPPYTNTWNLRQAYGEIGSSEGANGFALRVGRQELDYGNGRLIGKSWWTNVSRSFDALKGTYRRNGYKVEVFIGSVVILRDGVFNHHNQGNNLDGIYTTFSQAIPRSTLEVYTFYHVQHDSLLKMGRSSHLRQYTPGFRWVGALPGNFDYRTEMALQRGMLGPDSIRSWTGHWTGGYTFQPLWSKPRLFVEYDYASGDRKVNGVYGTFDPIYPSTHDKLGLADQIGWRNIRDLRFGQEFTPSKKWAVASSLHDFWLASRYDALYPTRGSFVARSANGAAGTHIGEEIDIQAVYKSRREMQIGAGFGHLFTGEFLNKLTRGKDFTYPYFLVEYAF